MENLNYKKIKKLNVVVFTYKGKGYVSLNHDVHKQLVENKFSDVEFTIVKSNNSNISIDVEKRYLNNKYICNLQYFLDNDVRLNFTRQNAFLVLLAGMTQVDVPKYEDDIITDVNCFQSVPDEAYKKLSPSKRKVYHLLLVYFNKHVGHKNIAILDKICEELNIIDDSATKVTIRKIITILIHEGYPIGANTKGYYQVETEQELDDVIASAEAKIKGIERRILALNSQRAYLL